MLASFLPLDCFEAVVSGVVAGAVAVGRRHGAHDRSRDSLRELGNFRDAEVRVRVARREQDARFDIFEAGRRRWRGVPGAYHSP